MAPRVNRPTPKRFVHLPKGWRKLVIRGKKFPERTLCTVTELAKTDQNQIKSWKYERNPYYHKDLKKFLHSIYKVVLCMRHPKTNKRYYLLNWVDTQEYIKDLPYERGSFRKMVKLMDKKTSKDMEFRTFPEWIQVRRAIYDFLSEEDPDCASEVGTVLARSFDERSISKNADEKHRTLFTIMWRFTFKDAEFVEEHYPLEVKEYVENNHGGVVEEIKDILFDLNFESLGVWSPKEQEDKQEDME